MVSGAEAPLEEPEGGGRAGVHDTFREAAQEGQEQDGAEAWGGPGGRLAARSLWRLRAPQSKCHVFLESPLQGYSQLRPQSDSIPLYYHHHHQQ